MLIPELSSGAADELSVLLSACDAAVEAMLAPAPEAVVIVGDGPASRRYSYPFEVSFAPWGISRMAPVDAGHRASDPAPVPLSLRIGAWLLGRADPAALAGRPVRAHSIGREEPAERCAGLGAELARSPQRAALLVCGDGSACRGSTDPMPYDPRGEALDATVARALGAGDPDALLGLDADLARQLAAAGRPAWQVLAGAARASGGEWQGKVHYDAAPYGVGYLVAAWERR